ncbi:MAG: hypothetical protein J6B93_05565 [Clostridia bacterium]|nr:hypothetical protein [Clostridia bacterium]
MKMFKKAAALILAVALVFTLAACHTKDEVAVSSGDYEITSAMYSYYLVMADSEAKGIIGEDKDIDTTKKGFSYYKQKIGDKTFEQYVKDLALENCLKHIAYQKLCDENKLTLTDEAKAAAQQQAYYYWYYYGYGSIFEANGVSYATYEKLMLNSNLADLYFKHLYDKDGSKAVSAADIQKTLDDNYAAVYMLTKDYSSEEKPDVDALKAELEKYKTRYEAGEDFAALSKEYNKTTDTSSSTTSTSSEETSSGTTSSEAEPAPQDENISILGSADTGVAFDKFDEVKKMEIGATAIISDTDKKVIYFIVKKDINADTYYRDEYLKSDILYLLKGDEYEKDIADYAGKLDYSVSDFAINQFKVKKINDGTQA